MRIFIMTCLACMFFSVAAQQNRNVQKHILQNLLEEREAKFKDYTSAIEKRSGIFGQQTKNDIRKSNGVLIDIVKADNRIISTLYSVVDFKNYEQMTSGYEQNRREDVIENLKHATDTLSRQVEVLKKTNHSMQLSSTRNKWFIFFLVVLCGYLVYRNRKLNKALIASSSSAPGVE